MIPPNHIAKSRIQLYPNPSIKIAPPKQILLEIGEMVISAFIGLIGLGPASRVLPAHSYIDRLLSSFNLHTKMPHMTSSSTRL